MHLRDHDRECEHGWFYVHRVDFGSDELCPGGARIDIDYQAAADRLLNADIAIVLQGRTATARHIINAALGIKP